MKEFANKYGVLCEREEGKEYAENIKNHNIKNLVFHIEPINFYDGMIDFPVMSIAEIPDCFKEEVNQAINQLISEFIETNNILDSGGLMLELDIRAQVNVTDGNTVWQFVIMLSDSECRYGNYTSKKIPVKDNNCLVEFKKYYMKKLETLFFGDIMTIGGL